VADRTSTQSYKTERFKAFVDAVVAIAMTLLILPLTESVAEAGAEGLSTAEFLDEHSGQLFSFALSFLLIANFWMGHHRQYDEVIRVTRPLLLCNVLWMATIVWLPVPTAMLGQMDSDPLQQTLYIGTLILTQVVSLVGRFYVLRHPELTTASDARIRHGAAADIATIILFFVALAISVPLGPQGYFALLLLVLTGPFARLILRIWSRARGERFDPAGEDAADV
jgi:uncharacterized membrane protein